MKVSDIVIQFLKQKQIQSVFTISGGGCIHLIDSLRKSDLTTLCPHHEQTALMAVEGHYRMNGKIAAGIVTTGPGGTNALTGLLGLWLDSIPAIIVSGQVPQNQMSEGTGCRQIGDQEFDIVSVVKPMTKYAITLKNPHDVYYELEKAYNLAISGRPGPVWIDIPLDVQGFVIKDESLCKQYNHVSKEPFFMSTYITRLEQMLAMADKPLVIVGNGINLSDTNKELQEFLDRTGIPIVTGPHSGVDVVDNTYKYYAGRIGILGQLTSNQIVQESDLLICLGTRLPVKMTGYNFAEFSPNSKKIMVDIDKNEIRKHKFTIDLPIIADLRRFFKEAEVINYHVNISNWQERVLELRGQQKYFYPKHESIQEYASFYYLIDKAPPIFGTTPIVTSNGSAHVITLQNYRINKGQRVFTNVGCASMGYGLPAAIGACIANDKKPVICIEGDGSIMMNLQELETLRGYNLPVKTIIINNDGYLSIKLSQESFFGGEEFASGPKNGVTIPNFQKISNAFDLKYFSIRHNSEIENGLKEMMEHDGPCILEVFTHPYERHEPKVTHKGVDENGRIIPGTLTDMFISETF